KLKVTDCVDCSTIVQRRWLKVCLPPCSVLLPSLATRLYSVPAMVNLAPAIRVAKRPTVAPN
ncbi:hypothetical protein, partial [Proteus mirabilis]|uniref:hypothetical protein n=1 Tax=Proteus mirabilis TaxID=584 RepID=UPI0040330816